MKKTLVTATLIVVLVLGIAVLGNYASHYSDDFEPDFEFDDIQDEEW